MREAGLMMDSAVATFVYTSEEILPLLREQMQSTFLPQSVPFYATTQNFLKLHVQHPEYSFKEATLNPTNPRDRAMDWEADLIQRFRNSAEAHEIVGERDTPLGRSLYLARPIRVDGRMPDLSWLGERRAGDAARSLWIEQWIRMAARRGSRRPSHLGAARGRRSRCASGSRKVS